MKTLALLALVAATAAPAQLPSMPSGGLSGMLGSGMGLPDIGAATKGNAAGLLGYCVKNNVLSGANATSVLSGLAGKAGVARSSDYAAGESGLLSTGNGSTLSVAGLKGQLRTRMCDVVLKRAKSFM